MDLKSLKEVLKIETGSKVIVPQYNYTMFKIRTVDPHAVVKALKTAKNDIETTYRSVQHSQHWSLLDFVALPVPKAVLLPIPFETNFNSLSDVVKALLDKSGIEAQVPVRS